ncbi:MAG TPA: 1-hydroxycarotenoid 3,4-desaturase CrtD [Parafilimonas sp.]|nr:1-hydroxycarotenoid 3,4-desaturase CrtD [Parafilimonas sp.]
MSAKQKALIIGAGVAGMACGIRLAVKGFEVTIFEKNNYPGGKLYLLEKDGYRFDTGPSFFLEPDNIEELFNLAGGDIHQYLHYKRVDINCRYFYEDGTVINAYSDQKRFAEELREKTGEPSQHLISYLTESEKVYNNIGKVFLNHSLHQRKTWKQHDILKALTSVRPRYIFSTLHEINKKKFNNPHVIQLLDRYATYSGSSPYKAPGMLMLIPHIECNKGVFYAEGGMMAINKALYNLALKKGVVFRFNSPVQRIIENNHQANGIVINNQDIYGNITISNADVYFTYSKLLNKSYEVKKIIKPERSSSAIIFYWGIKKEFPQMHLHNIFFSKNYKSEFNSIFDSNAPFDDPTIYINITSKMEADVHAPKGKENWFVMINVPSDMEISREEVISAYKKNILAKLNRILQTDIEPLIETESVLHPKMIEEETGSYLGALYGTSSNSIRAAFLRHPNFSKDVRGLYFTGGSVHPGGGIPLCLKSAKITADMIMHDYKTRRHE